MFESIRNSHFSILNSLTVLANDLTSAIDTMGFATIDRYLDGSAIASLIADFTALNLVPDRAGLRNILALVPSVKQLAQSDRILAIVTPILGDRARPVRGIFFDKQPTANWKVPWHQDLSIAVKKKLDIADYSPWSSKEGVPHVQPPVEILEQMLTVRIHLDRTDETNGALKVIPGSHRQGKLSDVQMSEWKQAKAISCDLDAGGVLLMRPLLLHASSVATIPTHRRVIHLEYAGCELPAGLDWYY